MTAGYIMKCTVCNSTVTQVNDWNQHLVTRVHEEKSRSSLCEWDENVRKCAIILYASFSIADESTAVSIIRKFTGGTTLVTDFVRAVGRPKMAILQFESSEKATEIFASGATQLLGSNRIQLRQLADLLEFEWEELMTTFLGSSVLDRIPVNLNFSNGPAPPNFNLCADHVPTEVITWKTEKLGAECFLSSQIKTILHQIEIPDDEFNAVQRIMDHMKLCLKEATNIEYTVSLYRNNFLKFRNNVSSNNYLILIYELIDRTHFVEVPSKETRNLLKETLGVDMREKRFGLGHLTFSCEHYKQSLEVGKRIVHEESGATIKLSPYPTAMLEVQLSRLVSFYCRLEPRVKTLLGLFYYWLNVNKISLTPDNFPGRLTFRKSPEPTNLEWLLLFFLCHEEMIIPAPVEIFKRPHKPVRLNLGEGGKRSDCEDNILELGFDDSTSKTEPEWKPSQNFPFMSSKRCALTVIEMFKKFMVFCSNNLASSCLVNTQTGKLLYPDDNQCNKEEKSVLHNLKRGEPNIFIIHPIPMKMRRWRISLDNTKWFQIVVPAMSETGKNLDKFLDNLKNAKGNSDDREELQRALHLNMEKFCVGANVRKV